MKFEDFLVMVSFYLAFTLDPLPHSKKSVKADVEADVHRVIITTIIIIY